MFKEIKMKKLYFLTIIIIFVLVVGFILFFHDENALNRQFLSQFGIEVNEKPCLTEEIKIPALFDNFYKSYNALQIESGLNLSPYKGKNAVRYTYEITNFPDKTVGTVFANVITVNSKPVAGDINSPALSGFILPLTYLLSQK